MTRRGWWILSFLTVTAAAVGGELYAAFDTSSNTTPWTELLVGYVPAPVTFAAIAVLVVWLPWHFITEYRKARAPKEALVSLDPTKPQPTEPLLTRATIVAGATAVIDLSVAFGVHLSTAQDVAILGVTNAIVVPLVLTVWARHTVFSPDTVARLLRAKSTAPSAER